MSLYSILQITQINFFCRFIYFSEHILSKIWSYLKQNVLVDRIDAVGKHVIIF